MVIAGGLAWRAVDADAQGGPVALPHVDYRAALKGARFVVGDNSQRFCVLEFFDYECPPCRLITPQVHAVVLNHRSDVSLALRNFPLNMHPHARQLALVACVLSQPEFEKFDPEAISLEAKKLDSLLDSWHKHLDQVRPAWLIEARGKLESEKLAAALLTVNSTPSIFVVDRLTGVTYKCPSLNALKSVISKA